MYIFYSRRIYFRLSFYLANKRSVMKIIYQNILFLFIGLMFGLKFSEYLKYRSLLPEKILLSGSISITNTTISLYNQTRVLCWVQTDPKTHKTQAIHVKNTWGKRCNKLLFISTESDDQLGTIQLSVPEGHDKLWLQTREAFKYIYENHFDDADWFLKTVDDTYIVMENLREFLYPMSTHAPVYFGNKFHRQPSTQDYVPGGAYVLSKEALYRFATKVFNNETSCKYRYKAEDFQMGYCLENIGVVAGDSRDKLGSNRFLVTLFYDKVMHWYWSYLFYSQNDTNCCSDSAIAFNYFSGPEMYSMEYLLYDLRPYGLAKNFTLPKKFNMDALIQNWTHARPLSITNTNVTKSLK